MQLFFKSVNYVTFVNAIFTEICIKSFVLSEMRVFHTFLPVVFVIVFDYTGYGNYVYISVRGLYLE